MFTMNKQLIFIKIRILAIVVLSILLFVFKCNRLKKGPISHFFYYNFFVMKFVSTKTPSSPNLCMKHLKLRYIHLKKINRLHMSKLCFARWNLTGLAQVCVLPVCSLIGPLSPFSFLRLAVLCPSLHQSLPHHCPLRACSPGPLAQLPSSVAER